MSFISDHSDDESLGDFFEKAYAMINEWLPEEHKRLFLSELRAVGVNDPMELEPSRRFFRIMNFLEVQFVSLPGRIREVRKCCFNINERCPESEKIADVRLVDAAGEPFDLSTYHEKTEQLRDVHDVFRRLLDELRLSSAYNTFVETEGRGEEE